MMMRRFVLLRPSLWAASWIATTTTLLTPPPALSKSFHRCPSAPNGVLALPMELGRQQSSNSSGRSKTTSTPAAAAAAAPSSLDEVLEQLPKGHSTRSKVLLLDGGTGEELMRQGLPDDRKTWSAKALIDPKYHKLLVQVHKSFLNAGAQVITTNSYGVTPGVGFSNDEIAHYGNLAGQLARQACHEYREEKVEDEFASAVATATDQQCRSEESSRRPSSSSSSSSRRCFVLGSLGPLRESYRPDLIEQDHEHGVQLYGIMVRALNPYVDAFVAETLSCVAEAQQAVEAVKQHATQQSCWVSFTLNSHGQLRDGMPVHQAIPALLDFAQSIGAKVPVVLFNCCEPEAIDLALAELQAHHMLPNPQKEGADVEASIASAIRWGAYANRLTAVSSDWTLASSETAQPLRTDVTPNQYAQSFAQRWVHDYGLSVVGGCCGITPEHIAVLKTTLQAN